MTSEGNTSNSNVRALKMTLRQWVKYFQTMSIISFFHVSWPTMPEEFFQSAVLNLFSFQQYNGPLAVGCLGDRQTVGIDMAFRWSFVLFIPLAALLASVLSGLVGFVCTALPIERIKQFGRLFAFGSMGVVKTYYIVTAFFFTALMQNGFMLMMCRSTPSGVFTVIAYPHLACNNGEWISILPVMVIYIFVLGFVFLALGAYIVKKQAMSLGVTHLQSRGQWTIISQDYRATHLYWPLVVQSKDVLLNIIAAAFGILGDGMLQLVFAGGLNLFYALFVMLEQPTVVFSNGVTDVWMHLSLFALIFMVAATGLQEAPNSSSDPSARFEEGADESEGPTYSPDYALREHMMYVVQLVALIGPATVFVVQLLLIRPMTSRLLPLSLKPYNEEGKQVRAAYLESALTNPGQVRNILSNFDACDFGRFNHLLSESAATADALQSSGRSASPSAYLRKVLVSNLPPPQNKSGPGRTETQFSATISV